MAKDDARGEIQIRLRVENLQQLTVLNACKSASQHCWLGNLQGYGSHPSLSSLISKHNLKALGIFKKKWFVYLI